MADYKQTTINGQKWNRFSRVVVNNPRAVAPSVTCVEEEVIQFDGQETIRQVGNLDFPFNPAETFDILNPDTNLPTGQKGSGAMAYALIYGYVMHETAKRDAAIAAAAAAAEAAAAELALHPNGVPTEPLKP